VSISIAEEIYTIIPEGSPTTLKRKEVLKFNLNEIDNYNWKLVNSLLKDNFYSFPKMTKFQDPYKSKTFYAFKYINIENTKMRSFITVLRINNKC
jgi:hypothetical protein